MATKSAPGTTKTSRGKKRPPPSGGVDVAIDLGAVQATQAQQDRLMAQLGNIVMSWLRYDVRLPGSIPVAAHEGERAFESADGEIHPYKPGA